MYNTQTVCMQECMSDELVVLLAHDFTGSSPDACTHPVVFRQLHHIRKPLRMRSIS